MPDTLFKHYDRIDLFGLYSLHVARIEGEMHLVVRLGAAVALVGASVAANAQVAYNNFGSGDSFDPVGNWSVDSNQSLMMPFISATTGNVSLVTVALFINANYTASLELDNNGSNPGTVLESWTFSGTGAAQALTGDGSASLVAGDNYWLEIDPATANDQGAWNRNSIGATGTFLFSSGGIWYPDTDTLSVFRVETVAAPEPFTLSALGVGLLALARRRRRA